MAPSEHVVMQLAKPDAAHPGSHLAPVELPVPHPGPKQALVRITLRPANPADLFSVMGVYPGFSPASWPAVPGLEGTGTVEALGEGSSGRISVGERVVSVAWGVQQGNGTWQQYTVVDEDALVPVPEGVSDEAAAMALVNPVTVIGMFEEAAVPAGDWLLITAAGSALGRLAIAYAKTLGIKTVGTVRRKEQVQELKDFGADAVVVSTEEDWPQQVVKITGGKGAYAALDSVAGIITQQCGDALRKFGDVIVYGAMSSFEIKTTVAQIMFKPTGIKGFWLMPYLERLSAEDRRSKLAKALQLCRDGVFEAFVGQIVPLEKAAEAVVGQGAEARGGKILLQG